MGRETDPHPEKESNTQIQTASALSKRLSGNVLAKFIENFPQLDHKCQKHQDRMNKINEAHEIPDILWLAEML